MHGKIAQTEAQQQPRQPVLARHLAANSDRYAGAVGGGDGKGDQLEDGGMERIVQMRHRFVRSVHGERVLDQIIGADGQEVQSARE